MKKISLVVILLLVIIGFLLPIFYFKSCAMEQKVEMEMEMTEETNEEDARELSIILMNKELDAISHLKETDKLEWYKQYRNIVCKYENASVLSIFNYYTEEEIRLICRAVETECYGQSFESKVMIANVVFNRLESGKYGSTVEDIITSPNQFAYWRTSIPEDTIYAVMYGFEMADLTDGSLAFHSNEKTQTFGGMKYVTTDRYSKHHFYK